MLVLETSRAFRGLNSTDACSSSRYPMSISELRMSSASTRSNDSVLSPTSPSKMLGRSNEEDDDEVSAAAVAVAFDPLPSPSSSLSSLLSFCSSLLPTPFLPLRIFPSRPWLFFFFSPLACEDDDEEEGLFDGVLPRIFRFEALLCCSVASIGLSVLPAPFSSLMLLLLPRLALISNTFLLLLLLWDVLYAWMRAWAGARRTRQTSIYARSNAL
mmetsp:Transcript_26555/g.44548  ORF Transcript_26555/g.44548 Transcript_26555/m.44548 type:complete len:214 (-) Transcript_26555:1661-2302(-)